MTNMTNNAIKLIPLSNHYLTENDLNAIYSNLSKERDEIYKEKLKIMGKIGNEHSQKGDVIDRANQEHDLEIDGLILEKHNQTLQKIDDAIHRIQNDEDFGYCDCCGDEIGFKRLMIRSYTQECIDCKSLKEMDQMQTNRVFRI